jgi:RNA polymerase sigma factor (sigma-70 family)
MRFLPSFRGEDARAWLFTIVRNTWYSRATRRPAAAEPLPSDNAMDAPADEALDPEATLLQRRDVARVREALEQLPVDFREVIVLREIEGMSYKEIAEFVHVPIGTVMSRIARGRDRLAAVLKSSSRAVEQLPDLRRRRTRSRPASTASSPGSPRPFAILDACAACRQRVADGRHSAARSDRSRIARLRIGSVRVWPGRQSRRGRRALCWRGRPPPSWSSGSAAADWRSCARARLVPAPLARMRSSPRS